MSFSIAEYTPHYYADTDRISPLTGYNGVTLKFDNVHEARKYLSTKDQSGSEYFIADTSIVEYIGRDGDDSRYDWYDCECDCGKCNTCFQFKVIQDLEMIKRAAV